MSLNTYRVRSYLPRILWALLGLVVLAFIIRVALWEHDYYESQEGSERAVVEVTENPGVDETEPDPNEIYTVAADRPRFLSIEKLGIKDARVREVGTTTEGDLGTPSNIFDAGWYFQSGKPGQGRTMLLDGHNGGPTKTGIFKHLNKLVQGDLITIERGDGQIFTYEVTDNTTVDLANAKEWMDKAQNSPEPGKESLSIITCTGEWSQPRQTYLSRQFLRAVLVN